MTSGRKLTQEEVDRILELVGIEDGCFTGDTLTIEVDDVQKNPSGGGGGDFEK